MKSDNRFNLRPIWDATFQVFDEFVKLCDRHGLRYYVTDGNALGAVRHKGFIPWDDDLDISMPRPDYEKFIQVANELPPNLKFVYWKNTPEYYMTFGKIQETRKEIVSAVEAKVGHMLSNGIFIDVIPIDGYPKPGFETFWVKMKRVFLLPLSRYRLRHFCTESRKGKIAWLVGMVMSPFIPFWHGHYKMMKLLEDQLTAFPFEKCAMTGRACSRIDVLKRAPVPREAWGIGTFVEYDERQVRVPDDVHAHLRSEFGPNYMTPPPVDKQKPAHGYSYRCAWCYGPTKEV